MPTHQPNNSQKNTVNNPTGVLRTVRSFKIVTLILVLLIAVTGLTVTAYMQSYLFQEKKAPQQNNDEKVITPTGPAVHATTDPNAMDETQSGPLSVTAVNNYAVARTTGITYSSISGSGTSITSWRNGNSTDDNLSNSQPVGFTFIYNGIAYNQFRISTNGYLTFNNTTTVTGGEASGAYSFQNTNFSSSTGTLNTLAVFYDDQQTASNLGTLADLNASMKYTTTGSAGSRVLTVEWINMQDFSTSSTASLNYQVKLYEADGHIEFIYGTMTQSTSTFTYSLGLNASAVSVSPTAAELLTQQTANTATFSNTASNALATVPATNTQISFTPPAAPNAATNLTFPFIGATSVNLTYTDNAANEIGYVISLSTDGGTSFNPLGTLSANTTAVTITGLSPLTSYFFRVQATTEGQASAPLDGGATTTAAISGTKTLGPGGNYPTFSSAIADVNGALAGPVTFNVTAGATFPEEGTCISGGTALNTVVFQKSGAGTNPIIKPTGSASTQDSGICILGGDFITFDGIDVAQNGAGSAVEYGALIFNLSATNGSQNNTIKNSKITLNRVNTSSIGINQTLSVAATNATGANSNNKYYNITIENSFVGILLNGTSTTVPDLNNEIGVTGGGSTIVGAASANDIGNATGTAVTWGIRAISQSGVKIFNTEVRNVTGTGTGSVQGIWLDNIGSTTDSVGTCEIFNNKVHDVKSTSTSATSHIISGLRINLTGNAASAARVYNNFIYGIDNSSTNTGSRQLIGIRLQDGGSGSGSTFNIDFNNVRIAPSAVSCSNSDLEIGTTTPVFKVRNNILSNFTGPQTTVKHYTWASTSSTSIGAAGSISDRNDLYVSNTTNGFVGVGSATDRATLANWQTQAAGVDANSVSTDPVFLSTTDLHLTSSSPANGGSFFAGAITWANNDIDGNVRNVSTPDIGADEFTPGSLQFSAAPYTDSETNADHTFTVNVSRTSGSDGNVSINYAVTDGSATTADNDYSVSPASGTLSWLAGDSTNKSFTITVKGDTTFEPDETVNLTLSSATGGAAIGAPNPTTLTITNDDPNDVTFNASGNLAAGTYNNITINSPAVVTATGNVVVNGCLNLNSGATLNMGTFTFTGTGCFNANSGSTLGIGSAAGITTGATGNVQVSGTRTFSSGASYVYNGALNQAVGNALPGSVANLTIANTAGGNTVTGNSGQAVTGTLTVQSGVYSSASDYVDVVIASTGTLSLAANITVSGNWTNNGTFASNGFGVTFDGNANQSISGSNSTSFSALTISNTGGGSNIVSLAQNISDTSLNITSGVFDQGPSSSVSSGAVTVSSGATWTNIGTGDLTLSGGVANAGSINFNGAGSGCPQADDILIRSSVGGTQRAWSGLGTFSLTDVDVQDQAGSAIISVRSGTNSGNNGLNWLFVSQCNAYSWSGTVSTDWTNPLNWSPSRTAAATDILYFSAGTPAPIVTNVAGATGGNTETIAELHVASGVTPTFSSGGANTLLINAGAGNTGLDVSNLAVTGANALTIKLASGTLGSVTGTTSFGGGAHRLIGQAAGAISFGGLSIFSTQSGFTGNAFGDGSSAANGTADSVRFKCDLSNNCSFYIHKAGGSPFGASGNPSVVTFETGTTARFLTASGFDANGRSYSNLAISDGSVAVNATDTGSGNFHFDNLEVASTATNDSSLTYTGTGSAAITIGGAGIYSTGDGSGSSLSNINLTAPGGFTLSRAGTMTIGTTETARAINLDGNVTVTNGTTVDLQRIMLLGIANPNSKTVTVNYSGAFNGSSTGYVVGSMSKQFGGGSSITAQSFPIGTASAYSPIDVTNATGTGSLTTSATATALSGFSGANKLSRYWSLASSGVTQADLKFQYVVGDVVGTEANYKIFRKTGSNVFTQFNPTTLDTANHFATLTGVTGFSDWTLAEPAALTSGTISFLGAPYSDSETNADHSFNVTVQRTGGSDGAVDVNYNITDGTATTADNDYSVVLAAGVLHWDAGDSSNRTLAITIKGDLTVEPDETINLSLSGATGGAAIGGANPTTLTILNDDTPACTPPSTVYVDDNFSNPVIGQDPDGGGPATNFGCDSFATIQGGVTGVTSGGTVNVAAGTYTENVTIAQPLTLTGAGAASVLVRPATSNPNCGGAGGGSLCAGGSNIILVQASNVTISGMTLDGDNPGLTSAENFGGANIDARNGIITNHLMGVYNNLEVHHTTVKNIWLRGMYASSGGSFNFHDNTVDNVQANGASIGMFNFLGAGAFTNNNVSRCNDGISSNHSRGTTYTGNTVTTSASGIHSDNAGDSGGTNDTISGNTVTNSQVFGYGIWVFVAYKTVHVQNNTVTNTDVGYAVFGDSGSTTSTRPNESGASQTPGRTAPKSGNVSESGKAMLRPQAPNAPPSPPYAAQFTGNTVDGQNKANSTGVYFTTSQISFGSGNPKVAFTSNTVVNNVDGFYLEAETGFTLETAASFNRIVGNTNSQVTQASGAGYTGTLNGSMENNWWGCNAGPNNAGCGTVVGSGVDFNPWIVLATSASPNPIGPGGMTTVTADMTHNSANLVPSAVDFIPAVGVSFTATQGTIMPPSGTITAGQALATFTSTGFLSGTATSTVDGQPASTNITVVVPSFTIDDVTHNEGNGPGTTSYTFTITKTGSTAFNASVDYNTVDGSATSPSDFTAIGPTNVVFLPADTTKQVTVLVNGDTAVEPDEAFTVHLSNASGATIADADGTGTITNDDVCGPQSIVYVDDDWSAVAPGADPDGAGPATSFGCDSFATVQGGVTGVAAGGTVQVAAGNYPEQVVISKSLTLVGAGAATTNITTPGTLTPGLGGNLILVQVNNAAVVEMSNITVKGPKVAAGCSTAIFYGVYVSGGANLNLHDAAVTDIRLSNPALYGCQDGIAIRAGSQALAQTATLMLNHLTITGYQKGAVLFDGTGTTGTVQNSTITGFGPENLAQNAIQIGRSAGATVTGNTITGNECNNPVCGPDPFTQSFGTGLLIFATNATVQVNNNTISNNDTGVYNNAPNTTISGNTMVGNRYNGIFLDEGTATITGNTLSGPMNNGVAVVSFTAADGTTGNSVGSMTQNTITGATNGLALLDADTGDSFEPLLTAHFNRIISTTNAVSRPSLGSQPAAEKAMRHAIREDGAKLEGKLVAEVAIRPSAPSASTNNLENNWWGCNAGPGNTGCGAVTGTSLVDYDPWFVLSGSATPSSIAPGGTSNVAADMTKNSNGVVPAGTLPDLPIAFSATNGTMTPTSGTVTAGAASSMFTSTNTSSAIATLSVDNQNVNVPITVNAPSFSIDDITLNEGNLNTTSFTFTITKTGTTALNASVDYATVDGTAVSTGGTPDFTAIPTTNVVFLPADTTKQVTVLVNGDTAIEPTETFTVHLSNASGATIADADGLGTITNDDACGSYATVYVDDNWAGTIPGTDPDAGGPATSFGCDSFATIQAAVNAVLSGGTVNVYDGTYNEDVTINNPGITVVGFGPGSKTIMGPIGGPGSTVAIAANNVSVAGFTITRAGNNTTDWNNGGLNSTGISIQGAFSNILIHDNTLTGNRTGIDINNSSGHVVRNNVIDFNRTGLIFRNVTDNMTVVENFITNNWTVGVLFLDASVGSNVPPQTALNSIFSNNNISANWYGQVVDRQTGGSLPAPGANPKNFRGNWYGTTSPVVTTANSTEPGYAVQIPVAYGGSATPPGGQPDIAGPASANIKYIPFLQSGTDTNVETVPGRGTFGFQGVANGNIVVRPSNLQGFSQQHSTCGAAGTGSQNFVIGPATPPLQFGSLQYLIGANGDSFETIRTADFNNTRIDALTNLRYGTYVTQAGSGGQAAYLLLNIDFNGDNTLDDQIFFEPVYQSAAFFPANPQGPLVVGAWQQWDALNGGWWSLNNIAGAGPGVNVKSLTQYLAAQPNARILNTAGGGFRVATGCGAGAWDNFDGNLDDLYVGVSGANTRYDFEPLPRISISDVTQAEGDSGTTLFNFNVTLSHPSDQTITVDYETADDTAASPTDFTAIPPTTLTFNPGVTSLPVTVSVNGDMTFENTEQFFVNLSNVNANGIILDGQGVGTITNDDAQPSFSIDDVTHNEGDAGTTSYTFTISRTGATAFNSSVNYETVNGSATAPSDFTAIAPTNVVFLPADTTKQVTVLVNGDTTIEPNEAFTVHLSSASGATISDADGTGTITNDDVCGPQSIVYVDDDWVGVTPGTDPDGAGPATNFGCDSFATIQGGINGVATSGTVMVYAGTYIENPSISRAMTLKGAQFGVDARGRVASESLVRTNGNALAVFSVTAANVTIDGFSIDGDDPGVTGPAPLASGDDTNVQYGVRPTGAGGNLNVSNNIIRKAFIGVRGDVASQGNVVNQNSFDSIGNFDFGYCVSIRNNFYANVTNNKMTRAWTGVHINNHSGGGGPASFNITGNEIHSYAGGILYWLQFNGATGATINNNQMTAEAGAVANNFGVLVVSIQNAVNPTFTNNTVSGHNYGFGLFNVPTTSTITLGATNSVSGSTLAGIFLTDNLNFNPVGTTNFLAGGPGAASTVNVTGMSISGTAGSGLKVEGQSFAQSIVATGSTITGIATGVALQGPTANVTAHFNRILGSTNAITNANNVTSDLENNWWGCNAGPGNTGCGAVTGTGADFNPWIVLGVSASPASVSPGGSSTVTADMTKNSAGATPVGGPVPSMPVAWTATNGTMTPTSGTITAGQAMSTFTSTNTSPGSACAMVDNQNTCTNITVIVPSFSIDDVTMNEGNGPGTTSFTFTITKTGAGAASVDYATVDGSATAPSDYTAIPTTTLSFLSADTTKQVTVFVNGDTGFEANETFTVHLSNASGATISDADGTGTITNDDTCAAFATVYVDDSWVGTPIGSDPDGAGPATVFGCDSFATIQGGVTAVTAGGTVIVADGTYTENVTITKAMTLKGAQFGVDARGRAAAESVVSPAVTTSPTFLVAFSGLITIDGFSFSGGPTGASGVIFTSVGPNNNMSIANNRFSNYPAAAVWMNRGGSDITLDKNVMDGSGLAGGGQAIFGNGPQSFAGLFVTNNNVINHPGRTGLFIDGDHNVGESATRAALISGNLFNNNQQSLNLGSRSFGKQGTPLLGTYAGTISNNTFSNNTANGIQAGLQHVLVSGNTFSGNAIDGLALTSFGSAAADRGAQNSVIKSNTFTTSGRAGIFFSGTQGVGLIETNHASLNRIFGNVVGVQYGSTVNAGNNATIDVENNWWGCNFGPGTGGAGCSGTPNGTLVFAGNTGVLDSDPWIVLGVSASPNPIPPFGNSTVTADMRFNSAGADTSGAGFVPQVPVSFTATNGTMAPPAGTITSGQAMSTFTSTSSSNGSACSMVDNQNICTTINITLPSFSIDDVTMNEGNGPGTTSFTFTITKTGAGAASVDYATVDGSATAPSDYTAIPTTTLSFLSADTTKQVTVFVNGDTGFEVDEAFTVHLSNAVGGTISDADGTGTITNDDVCGPQSIVYVDDDWAGTLMGADPDGAGPATNFGCDSFATVQGGVTGVAAGGSVQVAAGNYPEQVVISKSLTLVGAGAATTNITTPGTLTPGLGGNLILVQVNNAAVVEMSNITVKGPKVAAGCSTAIFYGVYVSGGANLNLHDAAVTDIRLSNPALYGCQDGIAIRAGSQALAQTATLMLNHLTITGYQKGAVLFDGTGTTGTVQNSTITGFGPENLAQNAIQIGRSAGATVTGNTITGNECNNPVCGPDPFTQQFGTGLLIFATNATVQVNNNTISNNDTGVYNNAPNTTISGNMMAGNRYNGIFLDEGTATITGNTLSGPMNNGVAVVSFTAADGTTGNSVGSMTQNTLTGAANGLALLDADTGDAFEPLLTAHFNRIISTTNAVSRPSLGSQPAAEKAMRHAIREDGAKLEGKLVAEVAIRPSAPSASTNNLENNWWGCNAGPGNTGCGAVTGTSLVDFNPWIVLGVSAVPTSVGSGGTSTVTADMTKNSDGVTPVGGPVPSMPVAWSATNGTMNPTSGTITAGQATSMFTSTNSSSGSACAMVDNQNTCTPITVVPPSFSIDDVSLNEGNAGPTSFTFTITKTGPGAASVDYETVDGSATAPSDYTAIPPTPVSFLSSDTTKQVTVFVNGDMTFEGNQTFTVHLSNAIGGTISDADGTGTILDDDSTMISGRVTYQSGSLGVRTVTMKLEGNNGFVTQTTNTDSNGDYSFMNVPLGNDYTLTPSKTGDVGNLHIESIDASNVARYVAGLDVPTAIQQIAADADGDSTLTSLDASFIARYVAGLPGTAIVGTWKFLPPTTSYPNLSASQMNQNFAAILVGDTDGNWMPTVAPPAGGGNFRAGSSSPAAPQVTVSVSLAHVPGAMGSVISVPMTVGDVTGQGVRAYDLQVTFNAAIVKPCVANECGGGPTEKPFDKTSTLSQDMTVTANTNNTGHLIISAFQTDDMIGSGTLLKLKFHVVGAQGQNTPLTFEDYTDPNPTFHPGFRFNAGNPQAAPSSGSVTVNGPTAGSSRLSGRVINEAGEPVGGVTITVTGGARPIRAITNRDGYYAVEGLETNGFYTVTPARANFVFAPQQRSFSLIGDRTDAVFTGAGIGSDDANPLESPEFFVRQNYLDFLGREPEQSGLDYWSGQLRSCGNNGDCLRQRRLDVSAAFFISQEFSDSGLYLYDLYQGSLGRRPDYAEYAADRRLVVGGPHLEADKAAFAAGFVERAEFTTQYALTMNGEVYVDALLRRAEQSSGLDLNSERARLLSLYQTGATVTESRSLVLRSVVEAEAFKQTQYNAGFVLSEYFSYLGRNADRVGYEFWLNVLNSGDRNNYRGMVCSFVTSTEYQRRFATVIPRSNVECR